MGDDDPNQPSSSEAGSLQIEPAALSVGYDNYQSVRDSNLLIFVAHDSVPPFRFKAGGWELLQSSIELGSAMKARIAEKGFFMFRVNEDRSGGVELSDPQAPIAEVKGKTQGVTVSNLFDSATQSLGSPLTSAQPVVSED
jgi:hypothetical protein